MRPPGEAARSRIDAGSGPVLLPLRTHASLLCPLGSEGPAWCMWAGQTDGQQDGRPVSTPSHLSTIPPRTGNGIWGHFCPKAQKTPRCSDQEHRGWDLEHIALDSLIPQFLIHKIEAIRVPVLGGSKVRRQYYI